MSWTEGFTCWSVLDPASQAAVIGTANTLSPAEGDTLTVNSNDTSSLSSVFTAGLTTSRSSVGFRLSTRKCVCKRSRLLLYIKQICANVRTTHFTSLLGSLRSRSLHRSLIMCGFGIEESESKFQPPARWDPAAGLWWSSWWTWVRRPLEEPSGPDSAVHV